jgi:hypothetical protein
LSGDAAILILIVHPHRPCCRHPARFGSHGAVCCLRAHALCPSSSFLHRQENYLTEARRALRERGIALPPSLPLPEKTIRIQQQIKFRRKRKVRADAYKVRNMARAFS